MLQTSSPSSPAAAAAAGSSTSVSSDRPAGHPAVAPEDEQQQASGGRQLQRLVDKLARHNWQLTYVAYGVALGARCDEIAATLAVDSSMSPGAAAAVAHQAAPQAAAAAVLADCAGGILWDVEAVAGGLTAGEVLGAEPELLLAATHRGQWGQEGAANAAAPACHPPVLTTPPPTVRCNQVLALRPPSSSGSSCWAFGRDIAAGWSW